MPYNSETETFYQAPATVVDSTPDGDTVQEGFDDRLTPAMAGLYADLNLLKADGMISVGIPATTTARGIGRVATSDDLVDGATITNGPAFLAAGVHTSVAAAAGKVPVADADGSLNSWTGARYAACSTAAATTAKVGDLANFQLVKGASVFVTFSNANTVAGALTLNVNGTGAKPIYNDRGATSASNIATWRIGIPIEFIYDGTNWVYNIAQATGNAMSSFLHIQDQKTQGTNGGTNTGGSWITRDLNTVVKNSLQGASLANNRITLPPGTYFIEASVPGYTVERLRSALYNYTSSNYLAFGTSEQAGSGVSATVRSVIRGTFTFTTQTTIELRMYTSATTATYGCGIASNAAIEIYSEILIWQI